MSENAETLASMGYNVSFLPTNAEAFWDVADPILQGVVLSTILFTIALVLVLAVVVFLNHLQQRKEISIMRSLGNPSVTTTWSMLITMMGVGIPAIVIGSVIGWLYAVRQAISIIEPLTELSDVPVEASISALWLIGFVVVALVVMFCISLIASVLLTKRSAIELLQEKE